MHRRARARWRSPAASPRRPRLATASTASARRARCRSSMRRTARRRRSKTSARSSGGELGRVQAVSLVTNELIVPPAAPLAGPLFKTHVSPFQSRCLSACEGDVEWRRVNPPNAAAFSAPACGSANGAAQLASVTRWPPTRFPTSCCSAASLALHAWSGQRCTPLDHCDHMLSLSGGVARSASRSRVEKSWSTAWRMQVEKF